MPWQRFQDLAHVAPLGLESELFSFYTGTLACGSSLLVKQDIYN